MGTDRATSERTPGPLSGEEAGATFGPIGTHHTDTADGGWDAAAAKRNLPSEPGPLRAAYAWVDPDGDPATKAAYKFVHHEVGADGTVGPANMTGCSTGIGVLNGGMGGTTIPKGDFDGVYAHLAAHLRDGDREPPAKNYAAGGGQQQLAKGDPPPAPVVDATGVPYRKWRMPVAVLEGVATGDGRKIAPEALSWRDLPQPLMANLETTQGHAGAQLVGRIDQAERTDASKMIDSRTGQPYGKGAYAITLSGVFTNDELASRVAQLIADRFLRGVSVDLSDVTSELEVTGADSADEEEADPIDVLLSGEDLVEVVTSGRIMGCTVTPFPAFEGAYIELVSDDGTVGPATQPGRPTAAEQKAGLRVHSAFTSRECAPCADGRPLVAGGGPQYPPTDWFSDPKLDEPTPLTVLDSGRVFGHLGLWDTCHTGYAGQCIKMPRSATGYAAFHLGAVKTAEGTVVPVGKITINTGHAGLSDSRLQVMRHYDHTGAVAADVRVGEDEHGVWVSGALRPDVTEQQLRTLRAASLSGDWRTWGGSLELLAVLAVNVPGFPVVRQLVASGAPQALVASAGLRGQASLSSDIHEVLAYLPELKRMRAARRAEARRRMVASRAAVARARLQSTQLSAD